MSRSVGVWLFLLVVASECFQVGKWFDHIIIFQFENHSEDEVLKDPNFTKYANMGRAMLNYFATTHPSQPNYWSQVAGSFFNISSDSPYDLPDSNIFDIFEAHGISYKGYMEAYPGGCRADESIGTYYRKHNPLISFNSVRNNATRCAKIVPSTQFDVDLDSTNLPNWSYFTPDINNDAHNTNVKYAGAWLNGFLEPRLSKFSPGTLIVISWDEDDYTEENQILVSLLDPQGTIFAPGSKDKRLYNHYSLLATVEQNWGLPNLGRGDANATVFVFTD